VVAADAAISDLRDEAAPPDLRPAKTAVAA
jgi:hypothetical protein